MRHATIKRALSSLACVGLLVGCGEQLDPASLLNQTRPVGVLFSVEGDPTSTRPAADETLNVTLLMAHAAEELPVSYFAIFCVPAPSTVGVPFCDFDADGDPILVGGIHAGNDIVGDPAFTLDIPSEAELDALGVESSLLMLGAFCQGRIASVTGIANLFDADATSVNPCSDPEDDGAILSTTVTLLRGDAQRNSNPAIASLTLAGADWDSVPSGTDTATGCMGQGLPEARQGDDPITVILRATGSSRETYDALVDDVLTPVRESLQVTSLATAGEMQRTFTFIDDERDVVDVEWLPPTEGTPLDGERVRFEFVMRDGRGGLARVRRQVCLLP
ncbi:MAG: hypothetical protein KC593_04270 [Myxococcales bacterium]|nr:hypothetical protein [Myxococcales bacterium]MCB9629949.1 hypothetical protein [Sandaracinaceae bacterium]